MGLFLGGAGVAIGLLVVGSLLRWPVQPDVRTWVVAAAAAVLLVRELGWVRFPLPQNARQVPQFVTGIPGWGALQFGAEMGTGMRTYSPTGLPHAMALSVLLLASWPDAVAAGVGFAAGRTIMVLSFVATGDHQRADRAFMTGIPRLRWVFALLFASALAVLLIG